MIFLPILLKSLACQTTKINLNQWRFMLQEEEPPAGLYYRKKNHSYH